MRYRTIAAVGLVGLGAVGGAFGQCLDWAPGFGTPGLGFDEEVYTLHTLDLGLGPALYAGGKFTQAGGMPAFGVARWTGSGWAPLGAGLGNLSSGYGSVYALCSFDDGTGLALYGAGGFSLAGGAVADRLARWNGTAWQALPQQVNDTVRALCPFQGELFVGGQLTVAGGQPTQRIASWNGSAWRTFAGGPSARSGHSLVFDGARQEVVQFGGTTNGSGSGATAETWTWNGAEWLLESSAGPPPSTWSASVYDGARQRVLLVAGASGAALWAWEGAGWNQVELHPPGLQDRSQYALAYDAARDRVVLFGGQATCCTQVQFGDTWEYDGRDWMLIPVSPSPPARAQHTMAYDPVRQRLVLYGGHNYSLGVLGDTWEWDGESWTQVGSPGPGARYAHTMTYDSAGGRILVFGGVLGGASTTDMWQRLGTNWSLVHPSNPAWPARAGPIVYDTARGAVVQQSTFGTTWLYISGAWNPLNLGAFNEMVLTLAAFDSGSGPMLYAGGEFSAVGGQPGRVGLFDGLEWNSVPGASMTGSFPVVQALLPATGPGGPSLYVGGTFEKVNGVTVNGVARWDGRTWFPMGAGLGDARDLAIFDDGTGPALHAAGGFWLDPGGPGSPPSGFVAKWTGTTWAMLGSGIQASLFNDRANTLGALSAPGGARLWVGGEFTLAGGNPSHNIARWGEPCGPPVISQHPQSQTAVFNQSVFLDVAATGTAPLTYQWRKGGVNLANTPGTSGVNTPNLIIGGWSLNDAGFYDAVVTNALGQEISEPAVLTIPGVGPGGAVGVAPIVVPPHPVPGMTGHTFTDFASPVQSSTGDAVIRAEISGPSFGGPALVLWRDEELEIIHKQLDQAPNSTPGVVFQAFDHWTAAAGGLATFDATLQGPGVTAANNTGIWHRDAAGTIRVIRKGLDAPGAFGNQFTGVGLGRTSNTGQVLYGGCLNGAGFPSITGCGLWLWSRAGGTQLVVLPGDPAPGVGAPFSTIGGGFLNDAGILAILGRWNNGTMAGIWKGPPGALTPVVKSGDPAAGNLPAGTIVASPVTGGFLLNDAGDVVAAVDLENDGVPVGSALYTFGTKTISVVALPGDPAAGVAGMTVNAPRPYAFNDDGAVVYVADLAGDCGSPICPGTGLWYANGGATFKIAVNRADPPPGAPPGFIYANLDTAQVGLNNQGQVVAQLTLEYGNNWYGIYGWTPNAGLFPIAVPGTQLEIAPEQFLTVYGAFLSATVGGSTGSTSSSLNDAGRVVFQVNFTNGKRGVFAGDFGEFAGAYFACPTVIAAPEPVSVGAGASAQLSVQAVGSAGPLSYQWRRAGVPIANGGGVFGANTTTLTINPVTSAAQGSYDVLISNSCGSTISPPAALTVLCYPDCTGDGTLTVADFGCFQGKYVLSDLYADCTSEGVLTVADFGCFQGKYVLGCP